jgi:hypothetical protein
MGGTLRNVTFGKPRHRMDIILKGAFKQKGLEDFYLVHVARNRWREDVMTYRVQQNLLRSLLFQEEP